jgi:hypothetical protein
MQEMPVDTPPVRPVIMELSVKISYTWNATVSHSFSYSGQKSSNHAFHLDVNQYAGRESYICVQRTVTRIRLANNVLDEPRSAAIPCYI